MFSRSFYFLGTLGQVSQPVKMVKNIQTDQYFFRTIFDEENAVRLNFGRNHLHHRHFDVQKQIVLQVYYVQGAY